MMNRLYQQSAILDADQASHFLENVLQSSTQYSIVGVSVDGTIQLWNEGARRLYGYEPEEVIGRANISMLHTPEDLPIKLNQIMAETLRTGQWHGQLLRVRRNGVRFLASVALNVRRDQIGRHIGFLLISRDISLEQKFRDLLESAPDATIVTDQNGDIVLVNAQAERLFGYGREELVGRSVDSLVPGILLSDSDRVGVRRDGTAFPVEVGLSPLETTEGTLISSSIRDITERRKFERALQEKNEELARANTAKDTFLASMSHELRTPLNAIIGFTGTMLMRLPGPLNTEQERQLRTVQSSGRHLLSLINDLLDLAKIESGKVELRVDDVNAVAVLQEVAALQRPAAETKRLSLTVVVPAEPVAMLTDVRSLRQILLNLASNAVKFTDQGNITLELRESVEAIEFRVTDTGCGIAPKDWGKLFQAFSQVGEPREGTGLGLLLSRRLAELLGGTVTMQSREGEGSTFCLTLPRV